MSTISQRVNKMACNVKRKTGKKTSSQDEDDEENEALQVRLGKRVRPLRWSRFTVGLTRLKVDFKVDFLTKLSKSWVPDFDFDFQSQLLIKPKIVRLSCCAACKIYFLQQASFLAKIQNRVVAHALQ